MNTNKIIEEQFERLPKPLQRAISLLAWQKVVSDIAKKYKLEADKASGLETETMLVMYGFDSQENFVGNIERELVLSTQTATSIAADINDMVFEPVLVRADEFAGQEGGQTLQTMADNKPETQEIGPRVIVESAKPEDKPINLIAPTETPKEVLLDPPKPGESVTSLTPAPTQASAIAPKQDINIVEKAAQVVAPAARNPHYPDGKDPYREPAE